MRVTAVIHVSDISDTASPQLTCEQGVCEAQHIDDARRYDH